MNTTGPVSAELRETEIGSIVTGLRESRDVLHNVRYRGPVRPPPSREAIVETLGQLTMALFPAHYGRPELNDRAELTPQMIDDYVGAVLRRALASLNEQVRRTLPFAVKDVPGSWRGRFARSPTRRQESIFTPEPRSVAAFSSTTALVWS